MSTKIEKDELSGTETTGHEWDGIKELNTPMPRWWLWTFYACILFAIGYCVLYPAVPLPWGTHTEGVLHTSNRLAVEADIKANAVSNRPQFAEITAKDLDAIQNDPKLRDFAVAGGRAAFAQNCAPCHGSSGQGAKGYPNLLDDVWLWGGTLDQIHQTIRFGVRNANPDTHQGAAMPAWGDAAKNPPQLLAAAQISAVADYVLSLNHKPVDEASAKAGQAIFTENCTACHGGNAEGNQDMGAPPLTSGVWLYGGDKATLVETITHGRAGQMPAWSERLDEATVKMLALYVHQLGGGK
jgi:cytochrome c oxidase cbb3-type subunit 3